MWEMEGGREAERGRTKRTQTPRSGKLDTGEIRHRALFPLRGHT